MRKELEEVAKTHAEQFSLWYTLDRPPVGTNPSAPTTGQLQPWTHLRDSTLCVCVCVW